MGRYLGVEEDPETTRDVFPDQAELLNAGDCLASIPADVAESEGRGDIQAQAHIGHELQREKAELAEF